MRLRSDGPRCIAAACIALEARTLSCVSTAPRGTTSTAAVAITAKGAAPSMSAAGTIAPAE